ncbi:hypothetical protein BYT27DRAFT_7182794 [Phlegmacium glaucopus]|nr:hypothetical protein BYT27DRAFT_7182794 [Phlegmacium glaucopus]
MMEINGEDDTNEEIISQAIVILQRYLADLNDPYSHELEAGVARNETNSNYALFHSPVKAPYSIVTHTFGYMG